MTKYIYTFNLSRRKKRKKTIMRRRPMKLARIK